MVIIHTDMAESHHAFVLGTELPPFFKVSIIDAFRAVEPMKSPAQNSSSAAVFPAGPYLLSYRASAAR